MKDLDIFEALDLIPYPLAIVTAGDPKIVGKRGGMTVAWLTRVSWNPPLIGIAIGTTRFTYELIREYKAFAIHIVSKKLENLAYGVFGSRSGRDIDKFSASGIEPINGRKVKAPIIPLSPVILECEYVNEFRTGDHVFIIGRVVDAYKGIDESPLTFYKGASAEVKLI